MTTQAADPFDLDPNLVNTGDPFETEAIRLPFPIVYAWWSNGSAREIKAKDARYFGGWSIDAPKLDEHLASTGLPDLTGFTPADMVSRDGKAFTSYISRALYVVPIASRKRWKKNDTGTNRSHLQVLCYAANLNREKKLFEAWGPIVLSAGGFAAQYLQDAFAKWQAETFKARKEFAKGLPSWFFYAAIGTFGAEPKTKEVGGAQKSTITPAQVHIPDKIDKESLLKWYIGENVAAVRVDLKEQAKEWLGAWKTDDTAIVEPRGTGTDAGAPPPPSNFPEDGIPF